MKLLFSVIYYERYSPLMDIDLDLCPSKRPLILQRIKEERGMNFKKELDDTTKQNCGCTLIATFGTEGTKNTILTACRGYRSEEYPEGIDSDTAQYISSLVPSERGFLWSLEDLVQGNEEKDRKPNKTFINAVNRYPGLLDIMMGIRGLINKRSSHASGVILFDEDPYEFGCFMKTPKGEVITQYDLHMCEAAGMTKYDFLVTEVQDKLTECIHLLQKYGEIEKDLSLREVYNKYLHPEVIDLNNDKCWEALSNNKVLNVFQFDSDVGSQAAKKIHPKTILEMTDANGLMRLMTAEKGAETPMEKYIRYKEDLTQWYDEMTEFGLSEEEQKVVEPYFKQSYGVPPSQEQLMKMLMDENICHFTLKEANAARKIVGKKQMEKIPDLREKVLSQAKTPWLGNYIWKCGVGPQMGYSFSVIHSLAYSFIGYQTLTIATKWNPIYWNTACLIVNSGSLEDSSEESVVDIKSPEAGDLAEGVVFQDLPDGKNKIRKSTSTDYAKMAKAIGDIISRGIKVSLIDINKSSFSFEPDVENNEILFGMKGLTNIGDPIIHEIIHNRPYTGIMDFMRRCPLNKTAMISLIKAGAFDKLDSNWGKQICNSEPRKGIMAYYLYQVCEPKKKLTLQNFNGLIQKDLIPIELNFQKRLFNFNKYLKAHQKVGIYYVFNEPCYNFYVEGNFDMDQIEIINGYTCIQQKRWDKMYSKSMDTARDWLKENQNEMLNKFNSILFLTSWNKYATGSVSSWEMDSLCFYYHEHELKGVDLNKYGLSNFFELSPIAPIETYFKRKDNQIPIYTTFRIIGTVLSKNDSKSSISLLTTSGVVNVKFTKDYFAMYNRQISEVQKDGSKKLLEKGWFSRGTKLMVTGFRRDDMFVAKSYKNTPTHQLYKIEEVNEDGSMSLRHARAGMEE